MRAKLYEESEEHGGEVSPLGEDEGRGGKRREEDGERREEDGERREEDLLRDKQLTKYYPHRSLECLLRGNILWQH